MNWIPNWRGYRIRTEILDVDDNGANTHKLVQVPIEELAEWDATHDEAGNLRHRNGARESQSEKSSTPGVTTSVEAKV